MNLELGFGLRWLKLLKRKGMGRSEESRGGGDAARSCAWWKGQTIKREVNTPDMILFVQALDCRECSTTLFVRCFFYSNYRICLTETFCVDYDGL